MNVFENAPPLARGDWRFDADNGVALYATLSGDSGIFRTFFRGYDEAFVLPDEKEDEAGFTQCLALNGDETLTRRYGPYREVCLVAHDRDGVRIGGANFIAMAHSAHITANLNYIYVERQARGRGNFVRLAAAVRALIASLFPGAGPALVFIEQNDPLAMSEEAYARDTAFTGLDQFARLRIWAKAGARVVDYHYVQPPLSTAHRADETLIYSVLGAPERQMSACVLEAHLRRFFGISVMKGAPIQNAPSAAAQLAALGKACAAGDQIALLDPSALLARIKGRDDVLLARAVSFRAALALNS